MRYIYTALLIAYTLQFHAQSIGTVGFTFSPDVLNVTAGTEISLNIGGGHTMTEVDEATWNANGNTSNGGFNYSPGQHTLELTIPGTYYYVCMPHSSMGMKGRIIVEGGTGIDGTTGTTALRIFPNPAREHVTVTSEGSGSMELRLIDASGREVLRHRLTGNDRIDVTRFATGRYTALVTDGSGTVHARQRITITR